MTQMHNMIIHSTGINKTIDIPVNVMPMWKKGFEFIQPVHFSFRNFTDAIAPSLMWL